MQGLDTRRRDHWETFQKQSTPWRIHKVPIIASLGWCSVNAAADTEQGPEGLLGTKTFCVPHCFDYRT